MVLSSILKKDFRGFVRQKKGWILFAVPTICLIFGLVSLLALNLIAEIKMENFGVEFEEMGQMFAQLSEKTYSNSIMMFMSMIATYYCVIYLIMISSSISKEISSKKWILPINAGIQPRQLFLSKLISTDLWLAASLVASFVMHFIFTITVCAPNGLTMGHLIYSYLSMLFIFLLLANITISLDFIIKKGWIGVIICLVSVIVLPQILNAISIGSSTLLNYTPLVFYNNAISMQTDLRLIEWIVSIGTYLVIFFGLPILAMFRNKIKNNNAE